MSPITFLRKPLLALLPAALAFTGCLEPQPPPEPPKPKSKEMVFTLNSDYKTGSYSTVTLDSMQVQKDIDAVGSDAVVRYLGGKDIFVLNRLGRDNAQVIDRDNLKTVLQFSFPSLSNPYDLALKDSLLYVGFYTLPKILVYGQSLGNLKDSIDISAYTDKSDGKPEVADLEIADGMLYILVANLDTKNGFAPLQAKLVRVKLSDKSVSAIDIPYGNPVNLALDAAGKKLYIPCRGVFFKPDFTLELDGGVVSVDLPSFTVGETLFTESGLDGGVNALQFHDGNLYMDLSAASAFEERIISFAPAKGAATTTLLTMGAYKFGGMDIDAETKLLYAGDRANGLRIYDLAAKEEKAGSKVSLGTLPILDLVVVK